MCSSTRRIRRNTIRDWRRCWRGSNRRDSQSLPKNQCSQSTSWTSWVTDSHDRASSPWRRRWTPSCLSPDHTRPSNWHATWECSITTERPCQSSAAEPRPRYFSHSTRRRPPKTRRTSNGPENSGRRSRRASSCWSRRRHSTFRIQTHRSPSPPTPASTRSEGS